MTIKPEYAFFWTFCLWLADTFSCLQKIRNLIDKLGHKPNAGFDRIASRKPNGDQETIYSFVSEDNSKPYATQDLVKSIVDSFIFTSSLIV